MKIRNKENITKCYQFHFNTTTKQQNQQTTYEDRGQHEKKTCSSGKHSCLFFRQHNQSTGLNFAAFGIIQGIILKPPRI